MTITIAEKAQSRDFVDGQSLERLYVIRGTDDEAAALETLKEEAPEDYRGLKRQVCRVTPEVIVEGQADDCVWTGSVPYRPRAFQLFVGDTLISFDTTGGTEHTQVSMETMGVYPPPPNYTRPNTQRAIGVEKNRLDSPAGVDRIVPIFTFAVRKVFTAGQVDEGYILDVFYLTGRTNAAVFMGFAVGEVLFYGASGSQREDSKWELTFNFGACPNRKNIFVGEIKVPFWGGWEYLWAMYEPHIVGDAQEKPIALLPSPWAVYLERLYDAGDFDKLGL